MYAETNASKAKLEWQSTPVHPGNGPDERLSSWLTYKGVLTIRMKESSPEPFRLQLLEPLNGSGQMLDTETIRRVILWSGETPCIYAESYLPSSALLSLPGLRQLGGAPLGEMLNSHPEISRGQLEFALLRSPQLPAPVQSEVTQPLWARRAKYSIEDSELIVAELFLPGITNI